MLGLYIIAKALAWMVKASLYIAGFALWSLVWVLTWMVQTLTEIIDSRNERKTA